MEYIRFVVVVVVVAIVCNGGLVRREYPYNFDSYLFVLLYEST